MNSIVFNSIRRSVAMNKWNVRMKDKQQEASGSKGNRPDDFHQNVARPIAGTGIQGVSALDDLAGAVEVVSGTSSELATVSRTARVVLRRKQAREKMGGIGNTMFHRIQNPKDPLFDESFPASFSIFGGRARGYFEDELDTWLERQAAKDPRRKHATKQAHGASVMDSEDKEMPSGTGGYAPSKRQKCKVGGAE